MPRCLPRRCEPARGCCPTARPRALTSHRPDGPHFSGSRSRPRHPRESTPTDHHPRRWLATPNRLTAQRRRRLRSLPGVTNESPLARSHRTRARRGFPYIPGSASVRRDHGQQAVRPLPAALMSAGTGTASSFSRRSHVVSHQNCGCESLVFVIQNGYTLPPFRSMSFLVPELEVRLVQVPVVPPIPPRSGSRPLRLVPGPARTAPVHPTVSHRGDPRRVLPSCRCDARNAMHVRGNGRTMGARAANLP